MVLVGWMVQELVRDPVLEELQDSTPGLTLCAFCTIIRARAV